MKDKQKQEFIQKLLTWFGNNHRILPWREEPTPYRVWISEIMLQQTRVVAVMPYFLRFLEALPDVEALAEVPEDRLLKLWEGLGYYNRARNLKKAAQSVMIDYAGIIPSDYDKLLRLSGIGKYTAGAIASIAYGKDETAIDGNVLRVFSRVFADSGIITEPDVRERMEIRVRECLPNGRAGEYNQSLMELGATVCLPNGAPKCEICPVQTLCKAHQDGTMTQYPKKADKKKRRVEEKTILVIQDAKSLALQKRPQNGLLAGLYQFPMAEGHLNEEEALLTVKKMGFQPLHIVRLPDSKHIFTHIEWRMVGYAIRVDELSPRNPVAEPDKLFFAQKDETEDKYPIPSAFAAYTGCFDIKLGNAKFE